MFAMSQHNDASTSAYVERVPITVDERQLFSSQRCYPMNPPHSPAGVKGVHEPLAMTNTINPFAMPNWVKDALETIASFARLSVNWDGYGSPPITMDAREVASTLITQLPKLRHPPFIAPAPRGGLQVNLRGNEGTELEFHVSPKGEIEYLLEDSTSQSEGHLASPFHSPLLAKLVRSLTK